MGRLFKRPHPVDKRFGVPIHPPTCLSRLQMQPPTTQLLPRKRSSFPSFHTRHTHPTSSAASLLRQRSPEVLKSDLIAWKPNTQLCRYFNTATIASASHFDYVNNPQLCKLPDPAPLSCPLQVSSPQLSPVHQIPKILKQIHCLLVVF